MLDSLIFELLAEGLGFGFQKFSGSMLDKKIRSQFHCTEGGSGNKCPGLLQHLLEVLQER